MKSREAAVVQFQVVPRSPDFPGESGRTSITVSCQNKYFVRVFVFFLPSQIYVAAANDELKSKYVAS